MSLTRLILLLTFIFTPAFCFAGFPIKGRPVPVDTASQDNHSSFISGKLHRYPLAAKVLSHLHWLHSHVGDHPATAGWPGIVSLVTGILGIAALFMGSAGAVIFLFIPFGICALIFGIIGLKKKYVNRGMALAGLILGGLEMVVLFIFVLALIALASIF
ncbi:MAG: DUF4190 domain-containing protein [Taibaiella sp.]|nr:DUF4190 domain-containing protein [Taibaiella sp.]